MKLPLTKLETQARPYTGDATGELTCGIHWKNTFQMRRHLLLKSIPSEFKTTDITTLQLQLDVLR